MRQRRIKKIILSERGVYEPQKSEEDILGQIRQMLEVNEARVFRAIERVPRCYRCGQWLGSSEAGTPDISGYFKAGASLRFPFWFEIKRPRAKRRAAQVERIGMIYEDGGCAAIVESWDEVWQFIEKFGYRIPIK